MRDLPRKEISSGFLPTCTSPSFSRRAMSTKLTLPASRLAQASSFPSEEMSIKLLAVPPRAIWLPHTAPTRRKQIRMWNQADRDVIRHSSKTQMSDGSGGEGIRTLERLATSPVYQTGAINRSATPPGKTGHLQLPRS